MKRVTHRRISTQVLCNLEMPIKRVHLSYKMCNFQECSNEILDATIISASTFFSAAHYYVTHMRIVWLEKSNEEFSPHPPKQKRRQRQKERNERLTSK